MYVCMHACMYVCISDITCDPLTFSCPLWHLVPWNLFLQLGTPSQGPLERPQSWLGMLLPCFSHHFQHFHWFSWIFHGVSMIFMDFPGVQLFELGVDILKYLFGRLLYLNTSAWSYSLFKLGKFAGSIPPVQTNLCWETSKNCFQPSVWGFGVFANQNVSCKIGKWLQFWIQAD